MNNLPIGKTMSDENDKPVDLEAIKVAFKRLKGVVPDWEAYLELSGEEAYARYQRACKAVLGDEKDNE